MIVPWVKLNCHSWKFWLFVNVSLLTFSHEVRHFIPKIDLKNVTVIALKLCLFKLLKIWLLWDISSSPLSWLFVWLCCFCHMRVLLANNRFLWGTVSHFIQINFIFTPQFGRDDAEISLIWWSFNFPKMKLWQDNLCLVWFFNLIYK